MEAIAVMSVIDFIAKLKELLPNATIGEDDDGQLVVYTDLLENIDGDLIPFYSE